MTDADAITGLLARHSTFAALGPEGLRQCAAAMRAQSLDAGQTLFLRGDVGKALYLVLEGRLRLAVNTQEGRELSVRIVTTGEVTGELAALDEGPRTADATAVQPTRVAALTSEALRRLIAQYPDFGFALLRFLCGRVRDTTDQLETIALHPIEVRLARFLLLSMETLGKAEGRATALQLGLSQGELAQLLGASRPKVNGAFSKLESLGALKREPGQLKCDRNALARIAGGEALGE